MKWYDSNIWLGNCDDGTGWCSLVKLGAFYTGKTVALEPSHQLNCYVSAYYHDSDISNNISQAIKIITLTLHHSYIEGIKFFMLKICLKNCLIIQFNLVLIKLCRHMITGDKPVTRGIFSRRICIKNFLHNICSP